MSNSAPAASSNPLASSERVSQEVPHTHAFGVTDLLLILMATIWGVNFVVVKYATHTLSPETFTILRIPLAAATMFCIAIAQGKSWPSRRDTVILMLLGVLGNGIYQLLFVNGVMRSRVADAALIVASSPAFVGIFSQLVGIERISARKAGGIALSIIGVGAVIVGSTVMPHRTGTILGAVLVVVSVIIFGIFAVSLRPLTLRVDPVQLNAITMMGGMIPMVFVIPSLMATPWSAVTPAVWGCVAYAGVISMGVAYVFYMRGLRVLGPTRTAIYGNLQPPVAMLVGWALLGEVPTFWQGIGAVLIVCGIWLTRS
jgi:drug/metabolite transporter (DMT)-like permease